MKTILKRTIGFFISLEKKISVACAKAVETEKKVDQIYNYK